MDPKPKRLPKLTQKSFDADFQSLFAIPRKLRESSAVHQTHSETCIPQGTPNRIEAKEIDFLDYLSGSKDPDLKDL